jgi:hypothetical protein
MIRNTIYLPVVLGLSFALSATAQAAPSVGGTSWDLKGNFGGTVKVKCKVGSRSVSQSLPIAKQKKLTSTIQFNPSEDPDVLNEGTFTWNDVYFGRATVTGTWTQNKGKLSLEFDNWYDSPVAAFGFGLAQVPSNYDFSKDGVNGSMQAFKVTKLKVSGSINNKGTKINISESLGFKFDASASAYGSSNTCSFNFTNLGRSYTGTPILQ